MVTVVKETVGRVAVANVVWMLCRCYGREAAVTVTVRARRRRWECGQWRR